VEQLVLHGVEKLQLPQSRQGWVKLDGKHVRAAVYFKLRDLHTGNLGNTRLNQSNVGLGKHAIHLHGYTKR